MNAFPRVSHVLLAASLAFLPAAGASQLRWSNKPPPPLHPTVVMGEHKGKQMPIVGVRNEAPQVEVEGKKVTLSTGGRARFAPHRGARFAPGEITLTNMKTAGHRTRLVLMFENGGEVDGGTVHANTEFTVTVTPTRDYKNCYVALVFFDQAYLDGDTINPGASVQFERIPDLVANQENKVKVSFGFLDFGERRTGYFPLFFTEGVEMRSNQAELIARFFAKMEDTRHDFIVKGFLERNAGKSAAPKAYLSIPPLFLDDGVLEAAPARVNVSFMVVEDGRVESVQLVDRVPAPAAAILRRTIEAWRFLPRVKDGYAARTLVKVPIVLKEAEAASAP